ncbi:MAG: hypothetical protein GY909_00620 [Oligoflexia bacterium]|nr:hypothetical protein [Oligoflexia bacterium]
MSIIEKIKAHEQEVRATKYPPDSHICPNCKEAHKSFKPHQKRNRLFLVIIGNIVNKIRSLLGRWRCLICGATFTYYPDFAIPCKRYVKEKVLELSRKYVEDDDTSYRKVASNNRFPIVHETGEHYFDHTTVWRWVGYIGSLEQRLSRALKLIREKEPSSKIFRQIHPVNPRKYRSKGRRKLLDRCMRLFILEREFKKVFNASNFTEFAPPFL